MLHIGWFSTWLLFIDTKNGLSAFWLQNEQNYIVINKWDSWAYTLNFSHRLLKQLLKLEFSLKRNFLSRSFLLWRQIRNLKGQTTQSFHILAKIIVLELSKKILMQSKDFWQIKILNPFLNLFTVDVLGKLFRFNFTNSGSLLKLKWMH